MSEYKKFALKMKAVREALDESKSSFPFISTLEESDYCNVKTMLTLIELDGFSLYDYYEAKYAAYDKKLENENAAAYYAKPEINMRSIKKYVLNKLRNKPTTSINHLPHDYVRWLDTLDNNMMLCVLAMQYGALKAHLSNEKVLNFLPKIAKKITTPIFYTQVVTDYRNNSTRDFRDLVFKKKDDEMRKYHIEKFGFYFNDVINNMTQDELDRVIWEMEGTLQESDLKM